MSRDAFPMTESVVGRWVAAGDLAQARRHVLEVYPRCLEIYLLGSSYRSVDDPADMVRGFLASRLERDSFFDDWIKSGKKLRYWLVNGLRFFVQEVIHESRRAGRVIALDFDVESTHTDHEHDADRAFRTAAVELALERTEAECDAAKQASHWQVFLRHRREGETFPAIAKSMNLRSDRAAVMSRTVERRFVKVLREILDRDRYRSERIDMIIRDLLEV